MTQAHARAGLLCGLGLANAERVGIMAPTGLAWELTQVAALLAGAAVVGLDAHEQPARLADLIAASGIQLLVVGDAASFLRIPLAARDTVPRVLCLSGDAAPVAWSGAWWTLATLATQPAVTPVPPTPQSIATLVFTSGSTGAPKGIAYTHAQVSLAVASILAAFPEITGEDRLVCWLPLSNLFQRMINFCAAGRGAQTYFVADPRTVMTHLPAIRPQVFIAVPRFFEKLNDGITQSLARQPAPLRYLAHWAMAVGERTAAAARAGRALTPAGQIAHWLAERLVLRRLRAIMGGEIRFMVSGSAPFPRWLLERFHGLGLLVLEAYGLSENVVPIAVNRVRDFEFGSVGRVLAGNDVRIAEDGEVLVRGAGVFQGYLHADPATSPVDDEGFLATGDTGVLGADGRLRLVGRKSEIFKTSTGRKIAPTAVEARLKGIPGVDQAVAFGAGRKAVVALITPALEALPALQDAGAFAAYATRVAAAVAEVMQEEPDYLRPAALLVHRRAFTIDTGELTSNLKLRRNFIEEQHAAALDRLFERLEQTAAASFCETLGPDTLMITA